MIDFISKRLGGGQLHLNLTLSSFLKTFENCSKQLFVFYEHLTIIIDKWGCLF